MVHEFSESLLFKWLYLLATHEKSTLLLLTKFLGLAECMDQGKHTTLRATSRLLSGARIVTLEFSRMMFAEGEVAHVNML